jgi:hypothetical protein
VSSIITFQAAYFQSMPSGQLSDTNINYLPHVILLMTIKRLHRVFLFEIRVSNVINSNYNEECRASS